MNATIKEHRHHEGIRYFKIIPQATDKGDVELIKHWRIMLNKEGNIIHTFFETMNPILNQIMNGDKGKVWEYLPLDEEKVNWPYEFIVYEIKSNYTK